jgi:hypothetical protein
MKPETNSSDLRRHASASRWLGALALLLMAAPASSDVLSVTLGNGGSMLLPGQEATILDVIAAQQGQPAPFDQGYGSDPIENFTATWTFSFAPLLDPVSAASLVLGLYDGDFGSAGSQLGFLSVAGNDVTAAADPAVEAQGGASSVYDLYTIDLGSILGSLAGGSVTVTLRLRGPVESPVLFPPPDSVIEEFNGAALIFATLNLTTRSVDVTEPGRLTQFALALTALLLVASRRRRSIDVSKN